MNTTELALLFLPVGIMLICLAALWQVYVVLSETHTLNRRAGHPRAMLRAALAMFFSFSLAVYWLCPNARRKGLVLLLMGGTGVLLYGLGHYWLLPYMGRG